MIFIIYLFLIFMRRETVFSVNISICGSFKNRGTATFIVQKKKSKKNNIKMNREGKKMLQDPRCIKPSALRDSRLEHTFLVPF